jgi:hypothetical protein
MGSDLFPLMHKEDEGLEVWSDLFSMMQQEDSTPDKMRHQVQAPRFRLDLFPMIQKKTNA